MLLLLLLDGASSSDNDNFNSIMPRVKLPSLLDRVCGSEFEHINKGGASSYVGGDVTALPRCGVGWRQEFAEFGYECGLVVLVVMGEEVLP